MPLKEKKRFIAVENISLIWPTRIEVVCDTYSEDPHIISAMKDEIKRLTYEDGSTDLCVYCMKHNDYVQLRKV